MLHIFAAVPYGVYLIVFFFTIKLDDIMTSALRLGIRLYVIVQAAMILLKLDVLIRLTWQSTLYLTWIFLIFLGILSVGLLFVNLLMSYHAMNDPSNRAQGTNGTIQFNSLKYLAYGGWFVQLMLMFAIGVLYFLSEGLIEFYNSKKHNIGITPILQGHPNAIRSTHCSFRVIAHIQFCHVPACDCKKDNA
jgi:hypothetical protein